MRTYVHQCKKCIHAWSSHGESHMACPVCKLARIKDLIEEGDSPQMTCLKIYDLIEVNIDKEGVIHSAGG